MIKILKTKFECNVCGHLIISKRQIVIDEYLKRIDLAKPQKCSCGRAKFNLLDLELEEEVKPEGA